MNNDLMSRNAPMGNFIKFGQISSNMRQKTELTYLTSFACLTSFVKILPNNLANLSMVSCGLSVLLHHAGSLSSQTSTVSALHFISMKSLTWSITTPPPNTLLSEGTTKCCINPFALCQVSYCVHVPLLFWTVHVFAAKKG